MDAWEAGMTSKKTKIADLNATDNAIPLEGARKLAEYLDGYATGS